MNVAKITEQKKNELHGVEYQPGAIFSPVQDKHGNWIVSLVEAQFLPLSDFEVIEFEPAESEEL